MILVGGVGQLWQGDLDLGRRAAELLAVEFAGREDVVVEDLYYGAVAVAQRLEELCPDALVLVGSERRGGRPAGAVEVRRICRPPLPPKDFQAAVGDAVTGYVAIDLLVEVAQGLGALPSETWVVEVEPAATEPSEQMSAEAEEGLRRALDAVRAVVLRYQGRRRSGAGSGGITQGLSDGDA